MSEATPPPESGQRPRVPGRKRRFVWRWTRRGLAVVIAVIAAVLVSVFTVDLGQLPKLREIAEQRGSSYLERPLHIGRLSARIAPGAFVLENVTIDGPHAGDRPFFHADRIDVHLVWGHLLTGYVSRLWNREAMGAIDVDVRMHRWQMTMEQWADGSHLPHLTPGPNPHPKPKSFTTTVSVFANDGVFTFEDHTTPWSVVAPNLQFSLVHSDAVHAYVGEAHFSGGTVQIQSFQPMRTDLTTRFVLDGPRVSLQHIDLRTDGTMSHVNGEVDFSKWPEQTYNVNSTVDFPTMKRIFFANESWKLGGTGQFTGVFHLFKGGRQLEGDFESEAASVDALDFQHLHGSLIWTPDRFAVTHADASVLGGDTRLMYELAPLGSKTGSEATFAVDYDGVDLSEIYKLIDLKSLRLTGRTSGSLAMQWKNGHFGTGRQGRGHTHIVPPEGTELASADASVPGRPIVPEPRPFDPNRGLPPIALGAVLNYTLDPAGWTFDDSWAATPYTYVGFGGRMASAGDSNFAFHVTSHDWQESDRLLTGIMTALSGPTGAIEIGGRGTFDGTMTGTFGAPRIAGHFAGDETRVWDVDWGRAEGDAVIEHGFVTIAQSRIGSAPDAFISAQGRFALGFHEDAPEEINAKVTMANWPSADLRHAFGLDTWQMTGTIGAATLTLTGKYRQMFGSGQVRIDQGSAWGEHFDTASGDVDLEGTGMRIHRLLLHKGPGTVVGDARVGWDGTYSFNADGQSIPVEQLDSFKFPQAPLTGRLKFTASGAGDFDHPQYMFRGSIDDLFLGDQGIGQVQGQLRIDDDTMFLEQMAVRSSLLNVDGRGTITFGSVDQGDLHFRFTESSIDPYIKFVAPQFSPYTRAVISGTLDLDGPLGTPADMTVDATLDSARLTLFDYDLRNNGPVRITFKNDAFHIDSLNLSGADTNLQVAGGVDAAHRTWDLAASGAANLAILQGFFPTMTAQGAATLDASLDGSFDDPRLTGSATITDGRLRPFGSAHSLEAINGRIAFNGARVDVSDLTGRIGNGNVDFGGYIGIEGYRLTDLHMTATGRSMRLRYPAGFNSTVDMDLQLTGPIGRPQLSGTVDVLRLTYVGQVDAESGLLSLAGGGATTEPSLQDLSAPAPAEGGIPLRLDIRVTAPRTTLVSNKTGTIDGTVDLHIGGTFDQPAITGTVDIVHGEWMFSGNRYFVNDSTISFSNPTRLEPVFDITAETRPRIAGETFDVTIHITGPLSRPQIQLSSDPWLPDSDILSLIVGGVPNPEAVQTPEQRALSSQQAQQQMLQTVGAALLAAPISSRVGAVFEHTLPIDTVQIVPYLSNETAFSNLNPGARVTLGKRISPRVYLTYSRTLNAPSEDQVLLIEYDESDRVSWVLSRNDDGSFSLDYRLRYVF